jgi:uncharacterized membrane protein YraQ (UPF0718 family)
MQALVLAVGLLLLLAPGLAGRGPAGAAGMLLDRLAAAAPTHAVVFVSIVLEALPFVLLGALVGGFIEVFVPREKLAAWLPARALSSVLLAGLMGLVFPVCECAVVPVVRRLVRKGVPFSAAIAYLLAGPIVNPIVAASTAVAYAGFPGGWRVVVLRLVTGYALAVAIGALLGDLFPGGRGLLHAARPDELRGDRCGCGCAGETAATGAPRGLRAKLSTVLGHAADDFLDLGRYLVLGAFIAALAQTFIDRRGFVLLMATPSLSILLMMALALGLNLCSEADAFVAASFQGSLPVSAQLAFLVLGPMLDLKLLVMYLGLLRRRAIIALAGSTLVAVFVAMRLLEWLGGGRL